MMNFERTLEEWRAHAVALMHAGERGGAAVIEANAAIIDLDRSDDAARTRLGFAYRVEGDFESAEAVYRQILEAAPPGSPNYRTAERALVRIERERVDGVVSSLEAQLGAVLTSDGAYHVEGRSRPIKRGTS